MIATLSTRGLVLSGAIMLHLLFFNGFAPWSMQNRISVPTEKSTRLSVGFIAARAGANSQARITSRPEKAAKPATQPIKPQPKLAPKAERKVHVKAAPKLRIPESKTPEQPIRSPSKPPLTPARQTQPAKMGNQGVQGSQLSANKTKETGAGQEQGGQDHNQVHDMAVRRHLLSRQQTPRVLGQRQGTVIVEFIIDRQGRLVKQLIGKSSGIREFDRAARQLVLQASPYPQAPADTVWEQRHYRIQIQYQTK